LEPYSVLFPDTVILGSSMGRYSYIQSHSVINNAKIGPFCSIAPNVHIGLASHPIDGVSSSPVFYDPAQPLPRFFTTIPYPSNNTPKTTIQADVWIGQGAMIKAGVSVGIGAVIGAGAMVTHDVEPYSVVGGVPAHEIKKRFDEKTIERLVSSRWWELDETTLERLAPLFGDPNGFLDAIEENSR
jgi:acetyltransferase-like isoleucine patch superfamily enzyme